MLEKGLLTTAGVILVGFVGYKIIKKQKPEWIDNTKKTLQCTKDGIDKILDGAKSSFQEGYASA